MVAQRRKAKWLSGAGAATVGLLATCTVCCAPLIVSVTTGVLVTLGLGAYVTTLLYGMGLALIALAAGVIALVYWRWKATSRVCERDGATCGCPSTGHP